MRFLVAAALALASAAAAQETGTAAVTGSHLPVQTASPVVVFDREQIAASGTASIGDFLQRMPEQGGALNTNVNNGGDGETQISLRNLGAQRTLVLVDGKRWPDGGSGPGSRPTSAVDLNSIPSAAVERIEVLKDGASAVYGSDAVAGVVNIITRRRMDGVAFTAYGGTSGHAGAAQYDFSVTGGSAGDRGSFMFTAGYFDQEPMFAGNRDWAANALSYNYASGAVTTVESPTIPAGRAGVNLNGCNGNALCNQLQAAFASALRCPGTGSCRKTFIHDTSAPACASGFVATTSSDFTACQIGGWRPMVGTALNPQNGPTNDLYNFQAVNYLITPSIRIQLFSNGDYNIANFARAYFQGSFVNRQSEFLLAPEPLSSTAFGALMAVDNIYNPFGATAVGNTDPACVGASPTSAAPAGCGQSVSASRRLLDAGGRSASFDISTIRVVAGIDGTLPDTFGPLQGVYWDLSFNYGRTYGTTTNNGSVITALSGNALAHSIVDPSSPTGFECGTVANPIAGCVPANLFAAPGAMTPAMLTSLGVHTGVDNGWTQFAAAQANFSAPLFTLASPRPLAFAGGWEYRRLYGVFVPDPASFQGNTLDFVSLSSKGGYHVNEGYLELAVPVVSHVTGAEDLELQGAVRAYNFSTFGSGVVYKIGALWRPVRDVALRGTWSTNIRAPDLSELYNFQRPAFEPATDPCSGTSQSPALSQRCAQWMSRQGGPQNPSSAVCNDDCAVAVLATTGGNPALQPENAEIGTVGLLVEPAALRGFSAELGYYNVKVTQVVQPIGAQNILDGCYFRGNDAYCMLIQRHPTDGFITNIVDVNQNVGTTQTSGLDFSLRYSLPLSAGRIGLLFDSTYLIYYRETLPSGAVLSTAGNYDLGSGSPIGGVTPKLKFNAGLDWSRARFSAGIRARYIGGFDECAGNDGTSASAGLCSLPSPPLDPLTGVPVPGGTPYAAHHVPAYVSFDFFLSYALRSALGTTTLAAGMRNVFDASPPVVYNSFLTVADPAYDFAGRFVYARIAHSF
jgi:iron complex outermembrane receptor protein